MAQSSVSEMFEVPHTVGKVLCPMCGVSMRPNPANICVTCLRTQVDITEGLQKNVTVLFCPDCSSYLQPPRTWIKAQLESKELLTFCVKRLKNLNKVRLVDAAFVWTEPHSKRLKVKLKIQKEVMHGAIMEQGYVVEYVVEDHMCESCSRHAANPDQWVASVQVRQKVDHKRTFFFLEQVILKHSAAAQAINIKQIHDGVDFFFANRSHALKFVDFLGNVVPIRSRHDKQLVSHDTKSNHYNYKFTFSVEICPICKDDLICLPQKVAAGLGNIGPLVLCARVSNSLLLLDPHTLRTAFVDATQFWRAPYKSLLTSRQLVEYVVLDVEPEHTSTGNGKYGLAQVQVARISDFGKNDLIFTGKTHLAHLLNPGDHALGYDLYGANVNDFELDKYKNMVLPDVVLVKKSYEEKRQKRRGKPRPWKLRNLPMEVDDIGAKGRVDEDKRVNDYERFMDELEEDPELRANVAVYRNAEFRDQSEMGSVADGEEPPSIPLDELLADLHLEESYATVSEDEDEHMDEL